MYPGVGRREVPISRRWYQETRTVVYIGLSGPSVGAPSRSLGVHPCPPLVVITVVFDAGCAALTARRTSFRVNISLLRKDG